MCLTSTYWSRDFVLQRLFSTFPDGWPGYGLLVLRMGIGGALVCLGVQSYFTDVDESVVTVREFFTIIGGICLLLGFWTPIAGTLTAIDEICIALSVSFSPSDSRWIHVFLAVLASGTAMVGPGAWSIDAVRFGRKRFDIGRRGSAPQK